MAAPIVVLCNARSGSTLLRGLLDGHPDIAAPPPTALGALCAAIAAFAAGLPGDDRAADAARVVATGRTIVDDAFRRPAAARGKSIWCDTSLGNVDHASALAQLLPDARYLCLHRHPMDLIASGLEACRWGFARYGFADYVRERPENTIAALAQYWIDRTTRLVGFERSGRCSTHRVRYEDLVSQPVAAVGGILDYLGLEGGTGPAAGLVARARPDRHDPGDGADLLDPAAAAATDPVGRGRTIPSWGLEPQQRHDMNALLEVLGYEPVLAGWHQAGDHGGAASTSRPAAPGSAQAREHVARFMSGVLQPRLAGLGRESAAPLPVVSFDISYPDGPAERWVADASRGAVECQPARDDGPEATYLLRAELLLDVAAGKVGFDSVVFAGLVRRSRPDRNQETDRMTCRLFADRQARGGPRAAATT